MVTRDAGERSLPRVSARGKAKGYWQEPGARTGLPRLILLKAVAIVFFAAALGVPALYVWFLRDPSTAILGAVAGPWLLNFFVREYLFSAAQGSDGAPKGPSLPARLFRHCLLGLPVFIVAVSMSAFVSAYQHRASEKSDANAQLGACSRLGTDLNPVEYELVRRKCMAKKSRGE